MVIKLNIDDIRNVVVDVLVQLGYVTEKQFDDLNYSSNTIKMDAKAAFSDYFEPELEPIIE